MHTASEKLPASRFVVLLVTLAVGVASVAGCESTNRSAAGNDAGAAAAAPVNLDRIRARYARAYPQSRVGVVIGALSDEPFAAVGQLLEPTQFRLNEPVTFVDGRGRVLTTGRVARVLTDSVHVQYNDPPRRGRAPRAGDVALLRLPTGASPL